MLQWVTSRIARAGLVLLIGICGPAGTGEKVRAQDAGEDHDSERSQRATEPVPYLLDTITVFAERTTKHVLDVPATVTVIDRADIEKRMVRDIDDLSGVWG